MPPYIPKAERDRAQGLSLRDAVARVRQAHGCRLDRAQHLIRTALAERKIRACYFDPEMGILGFAPPGRHWLTDQIDWKGSRVFVVWEPPADTPGTPDRSQAITEYDPFGGPERQPDWHPVLINKASFDAAWPPVEKPAAPEVPAPEAPPEPVVPPKARRRSKPDDRIRKAFPPDGVIPDDRSYDAINQEIVAKTGEGVGVSTLWRRRKEQRERRELENQSATPVTKPAAGQ